MRTMPSFARAWYPAHCDVGMDPGTCFKYYRSMSNADKNDTGMHLSNIGSPRTFLWRAWYLGGASWTFLFVPLGNRKTRATPRQVDTAKPGEKSALESDSPISPINLITNSLAKSSNRGLSTCMFRFHLGMFFFHPKSHRYRRAPHRAFASG